MPAPAFMQIGVGAPQSQVQFEEQPVPFHGAVARTFTEAQQLSNFEAREAGWRGRLLERHREIAKIAGWPTDPFARNGKGSREMGGGPMLRTEEEYEAEVAELRKRFPDQMRAIPDRAQMMASYDADLRRVRGEADQARESQPVAAFLGSMGGAIADPINLAGGLYTSTWGVGKPLLQRMLIQGGANAGLEAAQVPARIADTQRFGPDYTGGEALADIGFAGLGAFALEGLGSGLKAGWRSVRGAPLEAEGRRALDILETMDRDEAALGDLDGEAFEAGLAALDRGAPPPRLEPDRDLGDLFAAPGPAVRPSVAGASLTGSTEYRGRPIHAGRFDPAALETDAARFQYKADADGAGVTARLRGVEAWDATASGKVIVWEDQAGRKFVADGHQRRGLAVRMQEKGWDAELDGYLFREADGWTARQVRTVAALKNIREGSGAILDAAKVFRDAPEALADRSLPVTGDFIAQARALAKLSPTAFRAVINKVIPERYGAEIGELAGGRPELHDGMVRLLKEGAPANGGEARAMVFEALQDDWVKTEGLQDDLFGYDPAVSAMIGRAKVAAAVTSGIGRDAKLFAQLVKNADAIEAGGNALARDANQARLALDRAALEVTGRLALRHGPIGEAMAEAAAKVARGEATPSQAAKPIIQRVRKALAEGEDLAASRGAALDPDAPGPAGLRIAEAFDDPHGAGAQGQAKSAPEDEAFEAGEDVPADLFDGFDSGGGFARAREKLAACVAEG